MQQIIQALNLTIKNMQRQTKPIHDFYKNILDNVLDSKINNILDSTNLCLVKQIISAI